MRDGHVIDYTRAATMSTFFQPKLQMKVFIKIVYLADCV